MSCVRVKCPRLSINIQKQKDTGASMYHHHQLASASPNRTGWSAVNEFCSSVRKKRMYPRILITIHAGAFALIYFHIIYSRSPWNHISSLFVLFWKKSCILGTTSSTHVLETNFWCSANSSWSSWVKCVKAIRDLKKVNSFNWIGSLSYCPGYFRNV